MTKYTKQIDFWQGDFGRNYTQRNKFSPEALDSLYNTLYGISRSSMNEYFLSDFNKQITILEVGCNIGQQLRHLQFLDFKNLIGIELLWDAVKKASEVTENIKIIQASAFELPFKDNYFDLVFTSGLLIHISPEDIIDVIKEIHRCSKKYIWGFEYYCDTPEEVSYRGHNGFLWKRDYGHLYLNHFKDLKLLNEEKYKYLENENIDQMYLIEKK